jgi:hypothetical protein
MKTSTFLTVVLCLGLMSIVGIDTVSAQVTTTRVSTRQVQRLITKIETKIEVLKGEADRVAARTGRQDTGVAPDEFGQYLDDLVASMNRLDDSFDARQPVDAELREVMSDATVIDQFMARNRVSVSAQSQWRSLKQDFNTLASYNRLSWNWNQTAPGGTTTGGIPAGAAAYMVSDAQMRTLLSRIELKTDIFKRQMTTALSSTRIDNTGDDRSIADFIAGFEAAADRLKQRFDSRQSTSADVTDVLTRAAYIDRFMSRNALTAEAEAQWRNLRGDLNTLASNYRVSWNWNQTLPPYPGTDNAPVSGRAFDAALSGTYRLNTNLSENVSTAIDRALGRNATSDDLTRQRMERRLRSPEMIAIEKNNTSVAMASSNLPRVTFQADGVARSETNQNGRRITTTATADADGLIINYQGERANDFYVTFAPMSDGRLKVTRRVYLENTNESVTVSSVYDKVDTVARWNMVTTGGDTSAGVINETFAVPSGTRLNAVLRTPISSGTTQTNDRITLEVSTPTQYRGAVISGRVITEDASSRTPGRSRVLVSFDSIRLPNGQSYRFGGMVNGVIAANGDNISVTQQTPARQTRAGVGDVLGALIGAISGRPIDQTTATGVSGSILVQTGNVLRIEEGSEFIITATSDPNVAQLR